MNVASTGSDPSNRVPKAGPGTAGSGAFGQALPSGQAAQSTNGTAAGEAAGTGWNSQGLQLGFGASAGGAGGAAQKLQPPLDVKTRKKGLSVGTSAFIILTIVENLDSKT